MKLLGTVRGIRLRGGEHGELRGGEKRPRSDCRGVSVCQVALVLKNSPANAGDVRDEGLIPGLGRSPGGGHGNPLQYSCLENPMDRGAWRASVHGLAESDTSEAT